MLGSSRAAHCVLPLGAAGACRGGWRAALSGRCGEGAAAAASRPDWPLLASWLRISARSHAMSCSGPDSLISTPGRTEHAIGRLLPCSSPEARVRNVCAPDEREVRRGEGALVTTGRPTSVAAVPRNREHRRGSASWQESCFSPAIQAWNRNRRQEGSPARKAVRARVHVRVPIRVPAPVPVLHRRDGQAHGSGPGAPGQAPSSPAFVRSPPCRQHDAPTGSQCQSDNCR